ncbi:MAG: FprA family A-type flavoprotein [Hominilimicola sp.]
MLKLRDNIFYVGVKDTAAGAYNNAYLVVGEKTALIDTVSAELSLEYIKNIEEILPVNKIDYLICNHSEPDKSGAVKRILELNPNIEVVATIAAIRNLKEIANMTFSEHIAKDGAVLDLGMGIKLQFCIVPNMNWPDTMVTYEVQSKTLFSCDLFSAYCECETDNNYETALKEYYNCYFTPFKGFAKRAIEKISNFDIQLICTGYGSVIKQYVSRVIADYEEWSNIVEIDIKTVSVFFSSRYGNTAKMADTIKQTLTYKGLYVNVFNEINENTACALNKSDALIFGVPTENKNAPDVIRSAVSKLVSMSVKGKPYFVFGSYGWSGEGAQFVHDYLKLLKMKPFEKPFSVYFTPSDKDIDELIAYTERFSDMIENI